MRNYEFIRDQFLEKHSEIDNEYYFNKYISFLLEYKMNENSNYVEKHHILPKCTFPEYERESWNIIQLDYEDHKLVHQWLFKSINIRSYQKPLNWMNKNSYKDSQSISKASKRGWIKLKNNKLLYRCWLESRSIYMKNLSSREQSRRANIFWENMEEEDYKKFCDEMKSYWTDEKRIEKSKQMKDYYLVLENMEKKKIETQYRWNNLSKEERINFKDKMTIINKDKNKREDAGKKIKKLWTDDEYLEKMKNRKHRAGKKIKIIKPNGEEIIFETMCEIEREYNFSKHFVRKYRDKNLQVEEKHLNENKQLLGCIIESI